MNLCIDRGNSSTKVAVYNGDEMIFSSQITQPDFKGISELFRQNDIRFTILSSVIKVTAELEDFLKKKSERFIMLTHETSLPIINRYKTPETLGKDRLAAVTGAVCLMPGNDLLVIDAGTAITYDFVDASGVYHGGNIAPGINLRLKSLYEFTQNLPLVEIEKEVDFMGNDTRSAIQSGVLYGIVFEIDGYIEHLMLKYPKLSVFLTGGSSFYFENRLKNRLSVYFFYINVSRKFTA